MESYFMAGSFKIIHEEEGGDGGIGSMSSSDCSDLSPSSWEETDEEVSSSPPAFEMSSLLAQLPVKNGLSKYFHGKAQSFASLAAVSCVGDLAKPSRKSIRSSSSCGGDLHARKRLSPKRGAVAFAKKLRRSPRTIT